VTVGSTGGFAAAAIAPLNPGDEVILFEPYYGYHLGTLKLLGVNTKFVPLRGASWEIDFDELAAAFGPRTRGIVVCTPSNPCGKVFTREELEKIAALCREFDAWCYTDEIYEYIVYDGRRHLSMAAVDREIAVTISGFSKTFSVTGWRIGYVAAPKRVAQAIGLLNDLFYVCAPTPLQWGISRLDIGEYYANRRGLSKKRDMLADARAKAGTPFVQGRTTCSPRSRAGLQAASGGDDADRGIARGLGARTSFYASRRRPVARFCFVKDFGALEEACRRSIGRMGLWDLCTITTMRATHSSPVPFVPFVPYFFGLPKTSSACFAVSTFFRPSSRPSGPIQ
jgi:aminotransferase